MVKRIFLNDDWREIEEAFQRGGIQYYYLRVDKQQLTDETVSGIEEIYDHVPTEEDKEDLYQNYLAITKSVYKNSASNYFSSNTVKRFVIGDNIGWFDDNKRSSIKNSVTAEKEEGRTTSNIYVNDVKYELSCDTALNMINKLELYSKDSLVVLENHKLTIDSFTSIQDVENYNFTVNYPEVLSFNF